MSNDELTFTQRCALLILMIEDREVPNAELEKVLRLTLERKQRDALAKKELILVDQSRPRGPLSMKITKAGKKRAIAEIDLPVPAGAGAGGAALFRVFATLKVFLDNAGIPPARFFEAKATSSSVIEPQIVEVVAAEDLETLIRKTYGVVAKRSGDFVLLSRLRSRLGIVSRTDVDAALKKLNRAPDVSLVPESNQKMLTDEDREAAVVIGNQDRHLIAIGL
jgi:hypothetical protein